jgi:hypothetical protein
MRNPRAKPHRVLGVTAGELAAARAALEAFLDAADDQEDVAEAAARATHPLFADQRAWNHVKSVVGV